MNAVIDLCASLEASDTDTVATLTDRIYRDQYCAMPSTSASTRVSTIEALRQANPMRSHWERHWRVERVDARRNLAELTRGDERCEAPLAQIAVGGAMVAGLPSAGTTVDVFVPHERYFNDDAFYFVIGRTPHPAESGRQIRLYWNIDAVGAPLLARTLATALERRRIPFWFKAPSTVSGYGRCDAGVLYLTDKDLGAASDIIADAYRAAAAYLSERTPLFTHALAPGLAFAESPPGGESFGIHRATHCAHALIEARERGRRSTPERAQAIAAHFTAYGLQLDALHLNPGSRYPYPLDAIRTEIAQ